jgi:Transcriptional regulator, AbiEi antitoxin
MGDSRDLAAGRIAASQRTIVTIEQLAACGLGSEAIRHRIASGLLHVEFRGIYSFGCGVLPPLAREQAALFACGGGAFLSGRSSAFFWGMRKTAPAPVEVTVVGRSRRATASASIGSSRSTGASYVTRTACGSALRPARCSRLPRCRLPSLQT